jgi:uncharacterized membrane protein YozB (DUF420 family)
LDLHFLPPVNASLNALAAALLIYGRILIRRGPENEPAHKRVMISAFAVSSVFLVLYVLHKWSRAFENTTLNVEGAAQAAYLLLLASHVTLAMTVPVLAIWLIRLGLTIDRPGIRVRHRRLARWAWPVWMYVSVTGVVIYVLLYHLNP